VKSDQTQLLAALALVGIAGGPFLLGDGVDFPDDAIYHSLPLWEWLELSFRERHSPWFVPGKLGGVSLAGDSVPMGPLYPACWLLFVLPARFALPLAMFAHAIGTLLSVRWLAQVFGAQARYATLAGTGFVLGTTGLFSFIDCYADTMPLFLWFPVVIGSLERLDSAPDKASRIRWASLAAAALALLLLGSHLRWAAATGASICLWCLLRLPRPRWTAPAMLVGLLGGLPGFLPQLMEWRESAVSTERLSLLGSAAHNWVDLWNVAGILAPKPIHLRADHSIGFVLGCSLLLGAWKLRGPLRRLALFALLLFLTSASTEIPGLRYLFAPLLVLTHPVNQFHAALATIPAAVAGCICLQRMVEHSGSGMRRKTSSGEPPRIRPGPWVLGSVLFLVVLRAALPDLAFSSDFEWSLYLLACGQAALIGAGMFWLFRQRSPGLAASVFLLALLDLALMGVRFHLALPATPLPFAERMEADTQGLEGGYLHLSELADLEPFQYEAGAQSSSAVEEDLEEQSTEIKLLASFLQEDLLERRWPVHLGMAHGLRSGSGIAKMPPRRAVAMLTPLADALVTDPISRHRLQDVAPDQLALLFDGPSSLGMRVLRLMGLSTALGPHDIRFDAVDVGPRCYLPENTELVRDEHQRVQQLLKGSTAPEDLALIESPLSVHTNLATMSPPNGATVSCPSADSMIVDSSTPVLVVVRERFHPGWQIENERGERLKTFPVNQVHLGVIAPGSTQLQLKFVPPGLTLSMATSGGAWLLITLGLWRTRRLGAKHLNRTDALNPQPNSVSRETRS
jgi:hypothetical protein